MAIVDFVDLCGLGHMEDPVQDSVFHWTDHLYLVQGHAIINRCVWEIGTQHPIIEIEVQLFSLSD